jgi:hypothetical protein
MTAALIVLAKAPVPGRVKTRLCPPCTPAQAAAIARGALADTLDTVAGVPCRRRVLALDGAAGPWLPAGFDVVPQGPGGLASRLAGAFAAVRGPAFLVGMDTPQLTPFLLARALSELEDADAVLGLAADGGYWGIGLREADAAAFAEVPMCSTRTGRAQRARLRALGLAPRELPVLRDVDTFADAVSVRASLPPTSQFVSAVAAVGERRRAA